MRFLQCTLFHGAHDWVHPSPVIIQLNIKIRNFWRKKKKASQFSPQDIGPLCSAYSVPKASSFLVTGTSFPPKISHCCLHRDCVPEQTGGPTSRAWAGSIKASHRHLECLSPSLHVPFLVILCLLKPHPPLKKAFPLVFFQIAMWSKCWANILFYATFFFWECLHWTQCIGWVIGIQGY